MLRGKKIILGICGSIAAYKSAFLTRNLIKSGAEVRVIMTPDATHFISALTLSTLSNNPVLINFFEEGSENWNNHVEMGLWADAMMIAPASANTIAKMANGICDNLLLATYLSAKCPVYLAPAMDLDMWKHPATQANILKVQEFGNKVIPVGFGELASGLEGEGRMAEPEEIMKFLQKQLSGKKKLKNKRVLITAGPTQELIDPVRYISNHSTGKMGIAIAEAMASEGAKVTLLLGPTPLRPRVGDIQVIDFTTSKELLEAATKNQKYADIIIAAAAVADYKPVEMAKNKIKKEKKGNILLELTATDDVLENLSKKKSNGQVIVGFALETNDEIKNARSKLKRKNLDIIVLNSLKDRGAGFGFDTNKITILDKHNNVQEYQLKPKQKVAEDIVDFIINYINA